LFFVGDAESKLIAVEITPTNTGIDIGRAEALFTVSQPAGVSPYDVGPDGQWFVETAGSMQVTQPIQLITNWDAELTKP